MAESEELRAFWWKLKRRVKKVGLKLNIQKTKIMAYSPITSWQIDGETVETVSDFILLGSKITAKLKKKIADPVIPGKQWLLKHLLNDK